MSRADRTLVAVFFFGMVLIVALDDGRRFLGFLGFFALAVPLGLGMLLWGIVFQARSRLIKWAAFVCGVLSIVGVWVVVRNASLANDAFVQVADGVPPASLPFLRGVEFGERILEGGAGSAVYLGEAPTGEVRTLVWSDWVGNSYAVRFDVETDAVVSTFQSEFGRGVIGASYLSTVAAGFVLGLVVFGGQRYFARKRGASFDGKGV